MKKHQSQIQTAKPSAGDAKARPKPDGGTAKPGEGTQSITLPADPAEQRRAMKDIYIATVGANVLAGQMRPFVGYASEDDGQTAGQGAQVFVAAIKESVQPRDAVEEMLVLQLAWTHARLARLSSIAHSQEQRENVRIVNDACDRCAATFRQHMLALAEYRRPPRSDAFVAIRQANIAQQQVIAGGQEQHPAKAIAARDTGTLPAKALPPRTEEVEFLAPVSSASQGVPVQHGPQDYGGELTTARGLTAPRRTTLPLRAGRGNPVHASESNPISAV